MNYGGSERERHLLGVSITQRERESEDRGAPLADTAGCVRCANAGSAVPVQAPRH